MELDDVTREAIQQVLDCPSSMMDVSEVNNNSGTAWTQQDPSTRQAPGTPKHDATSLVHPQAAPQQSSTGPSVSTEAMQGHQQYPFPNTSFTYQAPTSVPQQPVMPSTSSTSSQPAYGHLFDFTSSTQAFGKDGPLGHGGGGDATSTTSASMFGGGGFPSTPHPNAMNTYGVPNNPAAQQLPQHHQGEQPMQFHQQPTQFHQQFVQPSSTSYPPPHVVPYHPQYYNQHSFVGQPSPRYAPYGQIYSDMSSPHHPGYPPINYGPYYPPPPPVSYTLSMPPPPPGFGNVGMIPQEQSTAFPNGGPPNVEPAKSVATPRAPQPGPTGKKSAVCSSIIRLFCIALSCIF